MPRAMHTQAKRRARLAAAREADFDEHRADVRSFGCDGYAHREYDLRGLERAGPYSPLMSAIRALARPRVEVMPSVTAARGFVGG